MYVSEAEGWTVLEDNVPFYEGQDFDDWSSPPLKIAIAIHPATDGGAAHHNLYGYPDDYWKQDDWVGLDRRYPIGGSTSAGSTDPQEPPPCVEREADAAETERLKREKRTRGE